MLLLLFTVGLELSPARLYLLKQSFWLGGSLQVFLTWTLAGAVLSLFPLSWREVAIFAAATTMSSTAVVLKLLKEREELEAPHGRSAFGILIFQDLLVVPLLVFLPWLAPGAFPNAQRAILEAGSVLLMAAALTWPLRKLLPRLFTGIARSRIREAFLFASLFACFGLAFLSQELGFSAALGAFVAGLVVSETDYRWQVVADVEPFRDLFASLFFISIGMLVDPADWVGGWPVLLFLTAATVAVKTIPAYLAVRATGFPARIAWQSALSLAQFGEFSFVLLSSAVAFGIVNPVHQDLAIDVAVATLLLTPLLLSTAAPLARALGSASHRIASSDPSLPSCSLADHVVLVGFGVGGQTVARVLREASIPYVVVEADQALVRQAQREGQVALFGDATRPEILRLAQLQRARVLLVLASDFEATCRILRLAASLQPEVHRIVRTRRTQEAERLRAAGAHEVIIEEFESAIEIFSRVLAAYHVPPNVIRAQERVLRGSDYEILRLPRGSQSLPTAVLEALMAGTTEVVRVRAGSAAEGRTLRELDLRQRTGVQVLALVRGEKAFAPPSVDTLLAAGDQLVLVGPHEALDRALAEIDPLGTDPSPPPSPDSTRG